MAMAMSQPSYGARVHECPDPLEGIDLEEEAELIRQKKSRLSASQRARVLRLVERTGR